MGKTKILVCAHKEDYVRQDDVYMPIQVGKAISDVDLGFQGDDTGDNISEKNKSFCELTAMYWAWKNMKDVDIIGFAHYRRYLDLDKHFKWGTVKAVTLEWERNNISDNRLIDKLLIRNDIVLAKKMEFADNLWTCYCKSHISDDIKILENVIHELTPEYDDAFEYIMKNNEKCSHFNILITRKEIFDEYCEWLFKILFEIEQRIDISNYSTYQKRIYGFMSEYLLNVYVFKHKFHTHYALTLCLEDFENISVIKYYLKQIRLFIFNSLKRIIFPVPYIQLLMRKINS